MKWIFLILLFSNVAFFIASYNGDAGLQIDEPEPIDAPLKLLNELTPEEKAAYERAHLESQKPSVAEVGHQALTDILNSDGNIVTKVAYQKSIKGYKCQTLGPIPSFEQADQISRWVSDIDEHALARKNVKQKHLGFWVVLPKLNTMKEGKDRLNELKAAGIKDALLFTKGQLRMYISLGLFNRRDHAETRKKELFSNFDVVAEIKPRIKDESDFWVDYKLKNGKKLPRRLQSKIAKESSKIQYKKWQCRVVASAN